MRKKILIIYLILFLILFNVTNLSFAQIDSIQNNTCELTILNTIKSDLVISFDNSLKVIKSPYYFNWNDYAIVGATIALTGASFTVDNEIRESILSTKSNLMDNVTYVGEAFGNAKYGTALSALLYTSGLIFDHNDLRETGQMIAEAMLWNGIFTELLKITFVRYRPYTGNENLRMEPFEFELDANENSLPSGHTSTAFTIATVLSEQIDNTYASIALYSLASLTAYQRVYADAHWFSDTFLGAVLGTFIGLKITSLHEKHREINRSLRLGIYPQLNSGGYKLGLFIQF